MKRTAAILLIVASTCSLFLTGADEIDNPHGDFREDCKLCHTANSWSPMRVDSEFDHAKRGFALHGAHKDTPCLLCHETLEFKTVSGSQCADCHQDVHLGELGLDCARCHSSRDFIDRSEAVRQHRTSRFPLTGSHLSTDCAACHLPGDGASMQFLNTPLHCDACHIEEFQSATNPDHATAGFSTDCTQCHSTLAWGSGNFDHALTGFPLRGAHGSLDCQSCHTDLTFTAGLSVDCAGCHLEDYQAAADPVHTTGFPMDCIQCHSTDAWSPAGFDHEATAFPLTGAHVAVDCAQCHTEGTYAGTPQDCFACHTDEYNATSQPQHASAGFSTDCVSCHGTTTWLGATFDHDASFFPIYSGKHRGKWSDCIDCHVNASNFMQFECIFCHEHDDEAKAFDDHKEVRGYQYMSTECLSCHPDGRD